LAIEVRIGGDTQSLDTLSERWIVDQIGKRGSSACVTVSIQTINLNLILRTPTCDSGAGGGRPPTPLESEIFHLWNLHKLNTVNFSPGDLIAFLTQLKKRI